MFHSLNSNGYTRFATEDTEEKYPCKHPYIPGLTTYKLKSPELIDTYVGALKMFEHGAHNSGCGRLSTTASLKELKKIFGDDSYFLG